MKRIKIILSLLLVIATSMSISAQRLWKVTGNGAKGTSYIFGTHHIAPVSIIDETPGLNKALGDVDAVYGEIEMAKTMADTMKVQQAMMAAVMAPTDSTLSKVLSPAQIDSVNAVLGQFTGGMLSVAALEPMKPAFINTQLGVIVNMAAFPGFDPTQQLDATLQNRIVAAGKPAKGLEPIEKQFAILFGSPISMQANDLMETIARVDKSIDAAQKLAEAYKAGNLEAVEATMFDPEEGMTPAEAERYIYERNRDWVNSLKQILPAEEVLVTVGIGHFVGEQGLINLLRQAGYTVEPVK